ncbi:hypothetical protein [Alloscardovia sp. HMSC034E08]|uniref:hypothetical protein n=1 Tax=Alloscardovia sp. HMSC034E08 TaxID=1739413 RepID=UPI0008B2FDF7|nr:hypothetical protein [Alloscardovia sp. HMSC034E08]OFQ96879.1 hypothetical protein HMPREF2909_00340 [Alloscardovia sp. HMSC034E08]
MTSREDINAVIRGELAAQRLSQTDLASYLGFENRRSVVARLAGECDWKVSELEKTAEFLHLVNVSQLFALAAEREKRANKR